MLCAYTVGCEQRLCVLLHRNCNPNKKNPGTGEWISLHSTEKQKGGNKNTTRDDRNRHRDWAEFNRNNQARDIKVHSKGEDLGLGDFGKYMEMPHTARL